MTQSPRTARPRLPAFHPVPTRARCDGWTPLRQAEFIGMLAETGSVSAAAAFVGMARETAYRLRRKAGAEEFARAWDVALVVAGVRPSTGSRAGEAGVSARPPRKVTADPSWQVVVSGNWRPVMRRGKYAGTVHKHGNSELLGLMAQLDRSFRAQRKELRAELRSQTKTRASVSGSSGRAGPGLRPPPGARGAGASRPSRSRSG